MSDNVLRILMQIFPGLNITGNVGTALVGTAFSATFGHNGGVAPYTFSILSALPGWLAFNATTATLSGTPAGTDVGMVTVRVQLKDGSRKAPIFRDYVFGVIAQPLAISGHIAGGVSGVAASGNYSSTGGIGGNVYTVISGTFPTTGGLSTAGVALGNWSAAGSYSWTAQVQDSGGSIATISDACTTSYATLTLTGTYPNGTPSSSYSQDLTIAGGNGVYSNPRTTTGALPPGLSLSIVNVSGTYKLRLSGTTGSSTGSYSFTAAVDSGDGQTATSAQTVAVTFGSHLRWRLQPTNSQSGGPYTAIADMEYRATVGGANIATGGTATADSSFGAPYVASKAFDGIATTWWVTASGFPHWIAYLFSTPVSVAQVMIKAVDSSYASHGDDLKTFTIEYSDDGISWTVAKTVTNDPVWAFSEARTYNL